MISEYIEHARNFKYMSGVERDTLRTKQTAEVFTPTKLVQEMLDNMNQELFEDTEKTFLDNMSDNIELCKKRLMGPNPTESIIKILNNNIVCADSLTYDYSFGQPVGIEIFS